MKATPERRGRARAVLGLLVLMVLGPAVAFCARTIGEERGEARLVPPWEWTAADLRGLGGRPAPRATPPPAVATSSAEEPPEGFIRAEYLVREGNAFWCQNRFPSARARLVDARELLEPMAARPPVHPSVERTLRLCTDLIDDIDSR